MRGRRREGRAEGEEVEEVEEGGGEEVAEGDGQRGARPRRTLLSPQWCFGRVLIPNDTGVRRYPRMKGMKRSTCLVSFCCHFGSDSKITHQFVYFFTTDLARLTTVQFIQKLFPTYRNIAWVFLSIWL
jgi:hypothetical protein